ncbi:hypothetical protein BVRB_025360, partial [Beta vulgaris subsp. vulgaris]
PTILLPRLNKMIGQKQKIFIGRFHHSRQSDSPKSPMCVLWQRQIEHKNDQRESTGSGRVKSLSRSPSLLGYNRRLKQPNLNQHVVVRWEASPSVKKGV